MQGPDEPHKLHSRHDRRASFLSGGGSLSSAPPRMSSTGRTVPQLPDTCPPFPLVPLLKARLY